jgi:hypothetical protein
MIKGRALLVHPGPGSVLAIYVFDEGTSDQLHGHHWSPVTSNPLTPTDAPQGSWLTEGARHRPGQVVPDFGGLTRDIADGDVQV